MSQWFEVTWPVRNPPPSLSKALDIVQHYLTRRRGDVTRDDVTIATAIIVDAYRKGETRHLLLANRAINALEAMADAQKSSPTVHLVGQLHSR